MTSDDRQTPRRFYHGTRADLMPGDLIAAGSACEGGVEAID